MKVIQYIKSTTKQIYRTMMRHNGDPEYISKGVAIGLFIGFLIPMGLQLVIAIPLAFLFKASKVMTAAFTFVTNPLTVFLIYPIQLFIGSYLIFSPLTMKHINANLSTFIEADMNSFQIVLKLGGQLIGSFLAGGFLFGVIAAFIGYKMSKSFVIAMQKKRAERRKKRKIRIHNPLDLHKVISKVTKTKNNKN